jgi:hypothetical protein
MSKKFLLSLLVVSFEPPSYISSKDNATFEGTVNAAKLFQNRQ